MFERKALSWRKNMPSNKHRNLHLYVAVSAIETLTKAAGQEALNIYRGEFSVDIKKIHHP